MKKILFVPRKKDWIEDPKNADVGVGSPGTLQERMGVEAVLTLDFTGKFNIDKGGYIYVFPGHGTAGSDTVHWVKEGENLLTAKEVAELTAERFPNCSDVSIKVYACHSSEGGFNSFANQFAQAFRPVGDAYDVTIYSYRGSVTTGRKVIGVGELANSTPESITRLRNMRNLETKALMFPDIPKDYTGPAGSVKQGANHRWSKVAKPLYASRASEARDKVAVVNAVKGTVGKRYVGL